MLIKQIRYSMRHRLWLRLSALLVTVGINALFSIFNPVLPFGLRITGISLSGFALAYLIIINIIASVESLAAMFKAPEGYSLMLTPVPAKTILLGRALPVMLFDTIGMMLGISGVAWLSLSLTNIQDFVLSLMDFASILFFVLLFFAGYFSIVMVFCFWMALSKSIFYSMRLRALLSTGVTALVLYLTSWVYAILMPFGTVNRYGPFFNINLYLGLNTGTIMYCILLLAQAATLFFATTHLMERKINL